MPQGSLEMLTVRISPDTPCNTRGPDVRFLVGKAHLHVGPATCPSTSKELNMLVYHFVKFWMNIFYKVGVAPNTCSPWFAQKRYNVFIRAFYIVM